MNSTIRDVITIEAVQRKECGLFHLFCTKGKIWIREKNVARNLKVFLVGVFGVFRRRRGEGKEETYHDSVGFSALESIQ